MRGPTFGCILAAGLGLLPGVSGYTKCRVEDGNFDFVRALSLTYLIGPRSN